jgi:putative transposase
MSHNYYSEINLHITWHTKGSIPLLTSEIEPLAHRALKKRLMDIDGVVVHEIGGIENHVHLRISIPPTVVISDLIGQLKGGSAHDVNQQVGRREKVLQWQAGYGVVSFGTRDLPWVNEYVRNQREHHTTNRVFDRLELSSNNHPVGGERIDH